MRKHMFFVSHFGERTSIAFDGYKQRVVTKPLLALFLLGDTAFDCAGGRYFGAVGEAQKNHRLKAGGAALGCYSRKFF